MNGKNKYKGWAIHMKKIISAFLAAAVVSASACFAAFAEGFNDATFCFDNNNAISVWETYGNVDGTGFKMSISEDTREEGRGSLCISESVKKDVPEDNRSGGAFISAKTLGLDSFKGCTVQMSVMFDSKATGASDGITIFSDGVVWISAKVSSETAGRWTKVSLTVPDKADNSKIGFTIPVYSEYEGNAAYIDNITIYKPDGTKISNVGDWQEAPADIVPVSLAGKITLIVVLVVLIAVAALCVRFMIVAFKKKFT